MNKKRGRPALYPNGSVKLRVVIPTADHRRLTKKASKLKRSPASVARDYVIEGINR